MRLMVNEQLCERHGSMMSSMQTEWFVVNVPVAVVKDIESDSSLVSPNMFASSKLIKHLPV